MVAVKGTWDLSGVEVHWKLAPALIHFVEQADQFAPHRGKRSDGSIASAGHYKNNDHSDHDPKPGPHRTEWVSAIDLTHDPKHGLDAGKVAEALRLSKDERIKYCIYDRRIFNGPHFNSAGARQRGAWHWGKYDGYDPHTSHLHLSVWLDDVEDTSDWQFPGTGRAVTRVPTKTDGTSLPDTGGERLDKLTKRVSALEDCNTDRAQEIQHLESRVEKLEQTGLHPADLSFLGDFVGECRKYNVMPNSLSNVVRVVRAARGVSGIEGAKELGTAIGKASIQDDGK